MIITPVDLETTYALWFRGRKNVNQAKEEILKLFSTEPDAEQTWSEQDIYEQSRKIIIKWDSVFHKG